MRRSLRESGDAMCVDAGHRGRRRSSLQALREVPPVGFAIVEQREAHASRVGAAVCAAVCECIETAGTAGT